jgi:hypothetical protein
MNTERVADVRNVRYIVVRYPVPSAPGHSYLGLLHLGLLHLGHFAVRMCVVSRLNAAIVVGIDHLQE